MVRFKNGGVICSGIIIEIAAHAWNRCHHDETPAFRPAVQRNLRIMKHDTIGTCPGAVLFVSKPQKYMTHFTGSAKLLGCASSLRLGIQQLRKFTGTANLKWK